MDIILSQSAIIALMVGITSGFVGSFIILKRMALVGDALSHVALPGIALALAYGIDPFWGVLFFLLSAAVLVWWLEGKTKLPAEAIIGLLFTASLSTGILLIPDTEILESLFGEFPQLSAVEFWFFIVSASFVSFLLFYFSSKIIFYIISPELAKAEKWGPRINLLFLLVFAFIVALGIKLVGTLLMGALTIIPASIAKNFSRSMTWYIILSLLFGAVTAVGGLLVASSFHLLPGPAIILLGVGLFIISLIFKK